MPPTATPTETPTSTPTNTPTPTPTPIPLSSLGDRVWHDVNANGLQDTEEITGVPGIEVVLIDALSNTPVATTTTGAAGDYLFAGLLPGDYVVQFNLPAAGWFVSPADQAGVPGDDAGDAGNDSDGQIVAPNTARTSTITLAPGENDMRWDQGLFFTASLGDRVWEDLDRNGQQDAGEPGVPGVIVTLYAGGAPISTTQTVTNGFYEFSGLTPGLYYSVTFALPGGFAFTSVNATVDSADSDAGAGGASHDVLLLSNMHDPTLDAGIWRSASLGDLVWLDADRDGLQGRSETGVAGVTVTLFSAGLPVSSTVTDGAGNYAFTGLYPGAYSLTFDLPAGYVRTVRDASGNALDAADSDADPASGATVTTTLHSGEFDPTWDMGVYLPASLGDYVWEDLNHNGVQEPGEPPLSGVIVWLETPAGVISDTTDGAGAYRFDGLFDGVPYTLTFGAPAAYQPTLNGGAWSDAANSDIDASGRVAGVVLTPGEHNPNIDAGFWRPASLGNVVWLDTNRNGVQDAGEPVVPQVTVILHMPGGALTTTTSVTGHYLFDGLLAGVPYSITFNTPDGLGFTVPVGSVNDPDNSDVVGGAVPPVLLSPGEHNPNIDAGLWAPPVLLMSKRNLAADVVRPEQEIPYEIVVRNAGLTLARSVVLTDPIPAGTVYIADSALPQAAFDGAQLVWSVPQLAPGEVFTVTFRVRVVASLVNTSAITNVAYLSELTSGVARASNEVRNPLGPTAVTLDAFSVTRAARGMTIQWRTSLERDTLGFHVLRADSNDRAAARRINSALVPSFGAQGGQYRFDDVDGAASAYYWLEEIELSGANVVHGPIQLAADPAPLPALLAPGGVVLGDPAAPLSLTGGQPAQIQQVVPGAAMPVPQSAVAQSVAPQPAAAQMAQPQYAEPQRAALSAPAVPVEAPAAPAQTAPDAAAADQPAAAPVLDAAVESNAVVVMPVWATAPAPASPSADASATTLRWPAYATGIVIGLIALCGVMLTGAVMVRRRRR